MVQLSSRRRRTTSTIAAPASRAQARAIHEFREYVIIAFAKFFFSPDPAIIPVV
jgi:hypothetical protein